MSNFLLLAAGLLRPRPAIDLPAVILRPLSHLPAAVDYLRFAPAVAILHLNSSPISICYLNDIGFVCIRYALLATSRGHAFVLTIDLSRLDSHNEKPASLLVP